VKDAIHGRELFTLEAIGTRIQGTCHFPYGQASGAHEKLHHPKGTGILILSGLLAHRTGNGDTSVYWADSFAKLGYTSIRVDLPGSCDSGGDAPAEFMRFIDAGSYEAVTAEIIKQVIVRYNLSSVIIMGHCTGSVTALFAASACQDCSGLVLMEPYFHMLPPVRTQTREAISNWAASNRLGKILSSIFDRLKELRLRLSVRGSELPGNANLPLLKRWKSLASAGVPILVLKAPDPKTSDAKPRPGMFDYMEYVVRLGGSRSRVEVKVIEGAAHSFADRPGRLAVRQYTEAWLSEHFPQPGAGALLLQDQSLQVEESLST
jgi:alpha-beta hydrolase superfamily lysophospholipase